MKFIKSFYKEYSNKVYLTTLLLILSIVSINIKEDSIVSINEEKNTSTGFRVIGESKKHSEHGVLHLEDDEKSWGYSYIGPKKKSKKNFSKINLLDNSDDEEFKKRVKSLLSVDTALFLRSNLYNYAVLDNENIYIENIANSTIKGFNDFIDIGLVINPKGMIDSIIYISSKETPSYIEELKNAKYFNQYDDLKLDKKHVLDAVAGATISSVAVAKSADELVNQTKESILKDQVDRMISFSVEAKLNYFWIVNLILLISLFLVFSFKLVKTKKLRVLLYVFTVIWLGFYLNSSFTYLLFIKSFSSIKLSVFTFAYILLVSFSSIWKNNVYCKSICPFGNAQKLIKHMSPFSQVKLSLKNKRIKQFRYLLSLVVIVSYFSAVQNITSYELFPHLFGFKLSSVMLYVSIFAIFVSLWIPNIYCRAFCPTGCALDLISDVSKTGSIVKNLRLKRIK